MPLVHATNSHRYGKKDGRSDKRYYVFKDKFLVLTFNKIDEHIKTSWGWTEPSSAQTGTGLNFDSDMKI